MRRTDRFLEYFFARFNYDKQYRTVSYFAEVCGRSLFGQVPVEVEPGLLDDLRSGLSRGDNILNISMPTHGGVVRIRHGPLAGFKGLFASYHSEKERVVVLLQVLSCQSRAVVKLFDIERFSEVTEIR